MFIDDIQSSADELHPDDSPNFDDRQEEIEPLTPVTETDPSAWSGEDGQEQGKAPKTEAELGEARPHLGAGSCIHCSGGKVWKSDHYEWCGWCGGTG